MIWLLPGAFAFVCFILSDYGKLRRRSKYWNLLFWFGALLLILAAAALTPWREIALRISEHPVALWILIAAAAGFLALLIHTLFFALPFQRNYTGVADHRHPLVDKGVFALCRHPGVLFFGLFFLCFYLIVPVLPVLLAFLIFTGLDILYVLWQDLYLFPKTISGYDRYKETTPFLLPNKKSIRRLFGSRNLS